MTTNFEKFKILLWKNWILQWSHRVQLFVELFLPVIFSMLLVMVRTLVEPEKVGFVFFNDSIPINNIYYFRYIMDTKPFYPIRYHLAYSPNTSPIFDQIVKEAASSLDLTYSGHANSKDLLEFLIDEYDILCGVEFDDELADITAYPQELNYKLRFPSESRTDASPFLVTWWTNRILWPLDRIGPRNKDFPDGGLPGGYILEGFLPVQYAITKAFITQSAQGATVPDVELQRYPYPPYIDDPLITTLAGMMGMVILLSYIYPCTCTVKYITSEKEKCLKEVMKMMGLQNWLHWLAWFVKAFLMMGFSAFMVTMVLTIRWNNDVAVLTYSSFTLIYLFLLVYTITSITLCFMLATFFARASTASAASGLIFLVMYLPNTMFELNYDSVSTGAKIACSLITNTGMGLGLRLIVREEATGEGLHWGTLFTPTSVDDDMSVGIVIIMMLLANIIHLVICLYMEQIYPGDFGVSKRWYFPFKKSYWVGKPPDVHNTRRTSKIQRKDPDAFEEEPDVGNIGVEVKNLTKRFGTKNAVDNLSMNMYENEITVLLGHNGAGKTTTISMLTGMFSVTSGTATINGFDIRTNIDDARSSLGVCPQHNILFDDLTVSQHLIFYGRLKGLEGGNLEAEVQKYLRKIDLEKKANLQSSKLSGGMQRKLSVCCAFCGGTKVVLCDEPSSGLDPAARRQLWDLLQSEKQGRTILLTTHFMDEADVLGDRIAIMSAGDLKCAGTSFFLKKKYSNGYELICVKKENCDSTKVTQLLSKYVPHIQPESEIGAELSYRLPDEYSSKFGQMFQDLEINSDALNLNGYGMSITSLEEVFMKTGAEEQVTGGEPKKKSKSSGPPNSGSSENNAFTKKHLHRGMALMFSQWHSMLLKKYLHTIRHKLMFAGQNFVPALFMLLTLIFGASYSGDLPPLRLDLYQFPGTVTVLDTSPSVEAGSLEARIADNYKRIVYSLGPNYKLEETRNRPFIDYILELGVKFQPRIDARYIIAATVSPGKIIAWLNNKPIHTAPVTVNFVQNAIAKTVIGPRASISVTNYPIPYMDSSRFAMLGSAQSLGTQVAMNLSFCMSFISSLYVLFLVKERISRAKLLQFVSGVRILTFWLSHLVWDIMTLSITAVVVVITLSLFKEDGYKTVDDLSRNFVMILLFCLAVLPFTYLFGSILTDPATGYAQLAIFNLFCGNAMFIIVLVMKIPLLNTADEADALESIFLFDPHYALSQGLDKLYLNSGTRHVCEPLIEKFSTDDLCYFYPTCCDLKPFFGSEPPGIRRELVYLTFTGLTCLCLVILKEYRAFEWIWRKIKDLVITPKKPRRATLDAYFDDDVEEEKNRVQRMTEKELAEENLVLDSVTKHYGRFVAVNQISLAVRHSECFGLLGVNGAGKTTTFKMMTGDEKVTSGGAYVKGWSLKTDMNEVYQEIGYCPQFDALFDEFTARETIKLYSLLRGIPRDKIYDITMDLVMGFGLMKHYNKEVHAYSGGNKRKLSTVIAVLGGPSVMYLDEPTTGMDPAARRKLWNMVCRIRDEGKSIILTSHSMEECQALCTRLAIMVNGEFKCIGSPQHLKNKFTKGLILKVKLFKNPNITRSILSSNLEEWAKPMRLMNENIERVREFIEGEFDGAYVQERFQGLVTFYIPLTPNLWSKIFGLIEKYKRSLNIEDYSISQTTLEEIFLEFAKFQRADPREIKQHHHESRFDKFMNWIRGRNRRR